MTYRLQAAAVVILPLIKKPTCYNRHLLGVQWTYIFNLLESYQFLENLLSCLLKNVMCAEKQTLFHEKMAPSSTHTVYSYYVPPLNKQTLFNLFKKNDKRDHHNMLSFNMIQLSTTKFIRIFYHFLFFYTMFFEQVLGHLICSFYSIYM